MSPLPWPRIFARKSCSVRWSMVHCESLKPIPRTSLAYTHTTVRVAALTHTVISPCPHQGKSPKHSNITAVAQKNNQNPRRSPLLPPLNPPNCASTAGMTLRRAGTPRSYRPRTLKLRSHPPSPIPPGDGDNTMLSSVTNIPPMRNLTREESRNLRRY